MPCVPCIVVIEGCGRVNGAARRLIAANNGLYEGKSWPLEGSCLALIEAIEAFADVTEKLLGCGTCYRLNPDDVAKVKVFCEEDLRQLAAVLNSGPKGLFTVSGLRMYIDEFVENLLTMSHEIAEHASAS